MFSCQTFELSSLCVFVENSKTYDLNVHRFTQFHMIEKAASLLSGDSDKYFSAGKRYIVVTDVCLCE